MTHRPFGLPRQAIVATALALVWFHPLSLESSGGRSFLSPAKPREPRLLGGRSFSSDITKSARSAHLSAEGVFSSRRVAPPFSLLRVAALLASGLGLSELQRSNSETLPLVHSATFSQAPAQTGAMTEIRALFAEYVRLHAAKKMDEWHDKMFLPEAICVQTLNDGAVRVYQIEELAKIIAEEAKSLDEQHEVFEDVRIEVYGNAAQYATGWRLSQNGKEVSKGRAFFSLVKKEGAWKIASLVWYRD